MKFGKRLKVYMVKDWQDHYMSYKRLKRIINRLTVQMKEMEKLHPHHYHDDHKSSLSSEQDEKAPLLLSINTPSPFTSPASYAPSSHSATTSMGGISYSTFSTSSVSPALLNKGRHSYEVMTADAKREFFAIFDNDIDRINSFFTDKLSELQRNFNRLLELIDEADGTPISIPSSGSFGSRSRSSSSTRANQGEKESESLPRKFSFRRQPSSAGGVRTKTIHEEALTRLQNIYRETCQLILYSTVNYEGLRKIMKKYDKNVGEDGHERKAISRLKEETFVSNTANLESFLTEQEELYVRLGVLHGKDVSEAMNLLRATRKEVENPSESTGEPTGANRPYVIWFCALLCILLYLIPGLTRPQTCLGLLAIVTIMWVTEAVPFFVTGLFIPFFVVTSSLLVDENDVPLPASKASKVAFAAMFNDTIMLILGGFSISAAFSKCQFELRLASMIQARFGSRPLIFMLAFMILGAFLSMWISNVAAPVLLTSLLLPIVRDFGAKNAYARALLLGLAFACNIGGMMSPISSPQNAIALGFLEQMEPLNSISFTEWMAVTVPVCTIAVLVSWLYITRVYLRDVDDIPSIPPIIYERTPMTSTHITVVLTSLTTIALWCSLTYTRPILGEMGTVAVLPFIIFFGSGILTKTDLSNFQWHLILLVGGGSVLGAAVNSSRLLHIFSAIIEPYLMSKTLYITTCTLLAVVFVITTFVSHTVASLILSPLIINIGAATSNVLVVVLSATLMMSGTMSLPTSSFPNMNALAQDDDFHRNFIHSWDFMYHGTAVALLIGLLLATVGYLVELVVL